MMCVGLILLCVLPFAVAQQRVCRDSYGTPYREGEEPTVENSWLRCGSGQLTLAGCLTPDGRRVALGQRIDRHGYQLTCQQMSPFVSHLTPTACIHDNRVVQQGQSVRTAYFIYTCRQQDTGVALEVTACMDENGREVSPGLQVVRGDFQYQCSLTNQGYVSLRPVGCLYDGVEYPAGTTFDGGKFWFTCLVQGNRISRRIEGCLNRHGQRITPGTTYQKNGFVMSCEQTAHGVATTVVGCTQELPDGQVVEHNVGARWTEGTHPFQYTVRCTTCTDGHTVMKSISKCKVGGAGRKFKTAFSQRKEQDDLDPGCMRPNGRSLACCATTNGGGLQLHMDEHTPENIEKWRQKGFRMC